LGGAVLEGGEGRGRPRSSTAHLIGEGGEKGNKNFFLKNLRETGKAMKKPAIVMERRTKIRGTGESVKTPKKKQNPPPPNKTNKTPPPPPQRPPTPPESEKNSKLHQTWNANIVREKSYNRGGKRTWGGPGEEGIQTC